MDMPCYDHPHPSIQTFRLGQVKEGIFHPRLPTFRRMEMDTLCCKLSSEECRHNTTCSYEDFQRSPPFLFHREPERLASLGMTKLGKEILKHAMAPDELRCTRLEWSKLLDKCPDRFKIRLQETADNCCKDLEFSGYAVRYMRPGVTAAWRRPLSRYIPSASNPVCQQCEERRVVLPF